METTLKEKGLNNYIELSGLCDDLFRIFRNACPNTHAAS